MQTNWEKTYYKKQFEWIQSQLSDSSASFFEEEAALLLEQVGRPFTTVLELGAGRGEVANELARRGKEVTTIELVEEIAEYASARAHSNVRVMCDDFYTVELPANFDLILYLDGFGVGTDQDQLFLLKRIYGWLNDDGYALIDIYQPLYWQKVAGREMDPLGTKKVKRKYDYDSVQNRMTDTWWETNQTDKKTTQSLACYSPEQIYALCEKANLQIVGYFPGGAMDFEAGTYRETTSFEECLSYRIKLKRK
ncbi:class I SAM-dependent methyltransferase [Jeotgalibaca caeni]|uniref:class I SAM-dependent methyltransferase n=1 Tax=Jeotgalibaca caeni TaxID=3028623 RepID=UPI00237E70B5|nr:class I SAM-dependent methyltransferase [Jeotgalibaca caeni]MDE1549355.1 class I SAM-dependent methyltransferase [Jeotgalibaca caeni]